MRDAIVSTPSTLATAPQTPQTLKQDRHVLEVSVIQEILTRHCQNMTPSQIASFAEFQFSGSDAQWKNMSVIYNLKQSLCLALDLIMSGRTSNTPANKRIFEHSANFIKQCVTYFSPVSNYFGKERIFQDDRGCSNEIIRWIVMGFDRVVSYEAAGLDESSARSEFPSLAVAFLKLLRIMSRSDKVAEDMSKASISLVSFVSVILKSPTPNPLLVTECAAILANTSTIESIRREIISSSSLQAVMTHLHSFFEIATVQTEICAALANLAIYDESCKVIVDSGGMKILEKLLLRHKECVELTCQVFHVLTNMSKYGKDAINQDTLIETIHSSLVFHECNGDLILSGLNAIGSLAFSRYNFGRWKDKISNLLLSIMRQYSNRPQFQVACCFDIAHLAYGKCTHVKGLELILAAMNTYETHRSLQTTACFALGSVLAKEERVQVRLMELGGLQNILASMLREYPKATKIEHGDDSPNVATTTSFHIEKSSSTNELALIQNNPVSTGENDDDDVEMVGWETASENGSDFETASENDDDDVSLAATDEEALATTVDPSSNKPAEKNKGVQKEFLLQMFAGVALINLAENEKIRQKLLDLGVVHYIYHAAEKVRDLPELSFVLSNVFMRFTHFVYCFSYVKPSRVPSLAELCCVAAMRPQLERKPETITWFSTALSALTKREASPSAEKPGEQVETVEITIKNRLDKLLEQADLAPLSRRRLQNFVACKNCKHPCYPSSSIRMYHLGLTEHISHRFCSFECSRNYTADNAIHDSDRDRRAVTLIDIDTQELERHP